MTVKITAITDAKGNLVAAQEAQIRGEHDAGLLAGPGQTLHELDVPEDVLQVQDPDKFHAVVLTHLPRKAG